MLLIPTSSNSRPRLRDTQAVWSLQRISRKLPGKLSSYIWKGLCETNTPRSTYHKNMLEIDWIEDLKKTRPTYWRAFAKPIHLGVRITKNVGNWLNWGFEENSSYLLKSLCETNTPRSTFHTFYGGGLNCNVSIWTRDKSYILEDIHLKHIYSGWETEVCRNIWSSAFETIS